MQFLPEARGDFELESSACRCLCLISFLKRHQPAKDTETRSTSETIREIKESLESRVVQFSRAGGLLKDLSGSVRRCVERQRALLDFSTKGRVTASEESLCAMHEALTVAAFLQARLGMSRDCAENLDIIGRERRLDVSWPPPNRDRLTSPNRSDWMTEIIDLNLPWTSDSHSTLLTNKLNKECDRLEVELWDCVRIHFHVVPQIDKTMMTMPKSMPPLENLQTMAPIAAVAWSSSSLADDTYRELTDIHGDLVALQEIQREFASHVERSGEKLGLVEEHTEEARAHTQETQMELVKAAKQKSKAWTFEGGALGCTVGAVVGLLAGPPGAVLGLAAGGAMGSAAGRALKIRHRSQLREIEERSRTCPPSVPEVTTKDSLENRPGRRRGSGGVLLSSGAVPVALSVREFPIGRQ